MFSRGFKLLLPPWNINWSINCSLFGWDTAACLFHSHIFRWKKKTGRLSVQSPTDASSLSSLPLFRGGQPAAPEPCAGLTSLHCGSQYMCHSPKLEVSVVFWGFFNSIQFSILFIYLYRFLLMSLQCFFSVALWMDADPWFRQKVSHTAAPKFEAFHHPKEQE